MPSDLLNRSLDQAFYQHDQSRLQADLAAGDTARVQRDLRRIQHDQRRLQLDEWYIGRDLLQPVGPRPARTPGMVPNAVLIPHPQYPGYGYYASNPTQLYVIPAQAGTTGAPAVANAVAATAPETTATVVPVPVVIANPSTSTAAVDFSIDGVKHTTPSGEAERVLVRPSAKIVFDRGGAFGMQRYSLSTGAFEFRPSAKGLELFKLEPAPAEYSSLLQPDTTPATTAQAPRAGESEANRSAAQR